MVIIDEVDDKDVELFSLAIEDCKITDTGEFKCVAMNEAGKAETVGELTVFPRLDGKTRT